MKLPDVNELGLPLATFLLMAHTSRLMTQRLDTEGGFGALTPSQFYTLLALHFNQGMPLSEISEKIRRSPGNMTLVIDNLEKDGLVERQRSQEDRRVVVAVLTPRGQSLINEARHAHRQAVEGMMSVLDDQEMAQFNQLLFKLANDAHLLCSPEKEPSAQAST